MLIKTLWQVWKNRRMDDYVQILDLAIENGYQIMGVNDARNAGQSVSKLLVLRHDVDHITSATLALGKLEHDRDSSATYYFRRCTFDGKLIKQLFDLGHEISFHYETIANHFKEKNLDPAGFAVTESHIQTWQKRLVDEVREFESDCAKFGVPLTIQTIAPHGDRVNRSLGFPGNRLMELASEELLPGVMDAYDTEFLDLFDEYISDSPYRICNGYRYGKTPIESIRNMSQKILFLSHPSHWFYRFPNKLRLTAEILVKGVCVEPHKFKK